MVKPGILKSQNTILSAALIIAISSGLTAVLGVLKNRILTYFFGISNDLAVFYTADRIPNLIYSVVAVGALSTIFIPVFTREHKQDTEKAWETANTLINATVLLFTIISGVLILFASPALNAVSLGKFTPTEV